MHNEFKFVTSRYDPLSWNLLIRKTTLAHLFLRSVTCGYLPKSFEKCDSYLVAPRPVSIHNGDTIKATEKWGALAPAVPGLVDSESAAAPMLWTDSLVGAHTHTERSSRT